jgi:hypothetical protein
MTVHDVGVAVALPSAVSFEIQFFENPVLIDGVAECYHVAFIVHVPGEQLLERLDDYSRGNRSDTDPGHAVFVRGS